MLRKMMKRFLRYMLKPMAMFSCIPCLGVFMYQAFNRRDLLKTSLLLYFGLIMGTLLKYFFKDRANI